MPIERILVLEDDLIVRKNLEQLPAQLELASARRLAGPRIEILRAFLAAVETESDGDEL